LFLALHIPGAGISVNASKGPQANLAADLGADCGDLKQEAL